MLKGFKDFILRGNVVDLAVGVVIGVAFGAVITSLVGDVITPLIAAVAHMPDFSAAYVDINGGKIFYGKFLNSLISFLIIAGAVYFLFVLPLNALMKRYNPPAATPTTTKPCPECLSEIPMAAKRCAHCSQPVLSAGDINQPRPTPSHRPT